MSLQVAFYGFVLLPTLVTAETQIGARDILARYVQSGSWKQSVSMTVDSKSHRETITPRSKRVVTPVEANSHFVYRQDNQRSEWRGATFSLNEDGSIEPTGSITLQIIAGAKNANGDSYYLSVLGPAEGRPFSAIATGVKENRITSQKENMEYPSYGGALDGNVYGNNYKSVADLLNETQELRLKPQRERLGDEECYILEGSTRYGKVTAWISPEKGYNAIRYTINKYVGDLYDSQPISHSPEQTPGQQVEDSLFQVDVSEVRQIGDAFIPVAGHFMYSIRYRDGNISEDHYDYMRTDITLKPDFAAIGAFVPSLPNGTKIHNLDFPGVIHTWDNGTFTPRVDDATIKSITETAKNFASPVASIADLSAGKRNVATTAPTSANGVVPDSHAGSHWNSVLLLGGIGVAAVAILGLICRFRRQEQ